MVVVYSPQEMQILGQGMTLKYPVIFLTGDLGAGKTTFAKGYAEGLGINPEIIHSPTYTYINVYDDKLLHIDMYRLEKFEEAVEKGIISYLNDYEYILIERPKWKDKLGLVGTVNVEILKMDENSREVIIL